MHIKKQKKKTHTFLYALQKSHVTLGWDGIIGPTSGPISLHSI